MGIKDKLIGKTVVITGATSGIGLATAKELIGLGAFIIGVGRSQEQCRKAEEIIRNIYPDAKVAYLLADLSSLRQVRELALNIKMIVEQGGEGKLDALINNAGTVSSWYISSCEGFELQFAVNYLAPFLLTNELMPLLKAAPAGRVIAISSGSHYRTRINWNDVCMRKRYNVLKAYKQSKLANVVFTIELNRRLGSDSTVKAYAVDPGLVNTDIGLKGTTGIAKWIWKKRSRGGTSPDVPAKSIAYMVREPSIQKSGYSYWKNCEPNEPSTYSKRADVGLRLWELSEKMCGIKPANKD